MYYPECVEPLLLVNRSAVNMAKLGCDMYMCGVKTSIMSVSKLLKKALKYTTEQISDCYVSVGEYKEPLYMYVPCGKCLLCRHRKSVDFISRCNMESQMYDCPPYFFTLTYRPSDLPFHGELQYKDVQDFFKRLRRSWDYRGIKHNTRYVVACEYGSRFHRPHYHVILWNNPYNASELLPKLHNQLAKDIFTAWGHSEPQAFDFGQCAGGAAGYVAKYLKKTPALYGHWTPMSLHASSGNGGIGSGLIKEKMDYYRKNPQKRVFHYIDKSKNVVVNQNFGQYITTHLWPSPIRLVPQRVKTAYKDFCDTLNLLYSLSVLSLSQIKEYSELMRPYKNVLPNKLEIKKIEFFPPCSTSLMLFKCRLIRLLDKYANEILVDYMDELVDYEYIELYYKYKSFNQETERKDIASKLLKLKQKYEVEKEKESF